MLKYQVFMRKKAGLAVLGQQIKRYIIFCFIAVFPYFVAS